MGSWEEQWLQRAMESRWGTSYGRPQADMRCAMCALDPHSLPDEAKEAFTVIFGYAICTDHFDQIFPGEDEAVEMRMRNMIENQIRKDVRQMFDRTVAEHEREQRRISDRRIEQRFRSTRADPPGYGVTGLLREPLDHKLPTEPADMTTEAREEAEAFLKAQEKNRRKREGS